MFNALGANFRHSHIWISYGPVLEHILISPAQHQVHHSVATKHHDKNYGSIFAIWDWIFGTLYVPKTVETLTFGVSDGTGKPMEQPYPTLMAAMVLPFKESGQAIRRRLSQGTDSTQTVPRSDAVRYGRGRRSRCCSVIWRMCGLRGVTITSCASGTWRAMLSPSSLCYRVW
ncbi:sterol desaturase family protein [Sulfitobacter sp.]|nr:sterol desaturase family protein [Sulfitobacter sp.]